MKHAITFIIRVTHFPILLWLFLQQISTILLEHNRNFHPGCPFPPTLYSILDRYRSRHGFLEEEEEEEAANKRIDRRERIEGRGPNRGRGRQKEGDTERITTTEARTLARLRSKYPQKQMPNATRPLPGPLSAPWPVPCSRVPTPARQGPRSRREATLSKTSRVRKACHTAPSYWLLNARMRCKTTTAFKSTTLTQPFSFRLCELFSSSIFFFDFPSVEVVREEYFVK